ncbi:hypothetical protein GCM10009716_16900 [Streptomyces sodiiphilus]|uniref:Integral membrane protein n=1 Tax=Streptomyces sodiiphilus TaxID=226217 RepID=A0ABP5AAL6_9ACTN
MTAGSTSTPREPDPRTAEGTEATAEPAMELLVHGVGGATPQDMLEDPRTVRVTGDGTAGIRRRTDDAPDRPLDERRPVREAYSWSNLTSGNGARALWLLLLPFMIANVAHWMRPAARGRRRAHELFDRLVRLIALSLTVLLVSGACAVSLDLVAWQCGGDPACARNTSWLAFMAAEEGGWEHPGRRMVLAAVLPVSLTMLLFWLSRRTWSAYESASPPVRARTGEQASALLSLPGFWYGRGIVSRLRAAHTAAGLLTVTVALLTAAGPHDREAGGPVPALLGGLLTGLAAAGGLAVIVLVTRHGRTETEMDEKPVPRPVRLLPWGAGGLLVLSAVYAAWERPGWESSGQLPAGWIFPFISVLQGVLVVVLALTAHRMHRSVPAGERGALAGLGGAAVALLGCALGGVLTGGVVQRFADWLAPGAVAGGLDGPIPGPPLLLSWQAAALPSLLGVALVAGLLAAVGVYRRSRKRAPLVPDAYPDENCEPHPERSIRIASAVERAALTDAAPRLVGWMTAVALVLGVVAVTGSQLTGRTPGAAAEQAPALLAAYADVSQALGSWLMGIGVVVMVAMGRRAYRDASARRTIGIIWDVGTFWPRAAHPFAPPCYAERAVPDLSWRMGTWVDATGGRVVISGHSQGSVLAAAAVWQLDAPTRSRIALLTYGSPLERLYSRWFPAYFGPRALASLHRDVPCWRNLWRATDPIGGPVGVGGGSGVPPVDREPLRDPLNYGRNLMRPLPEPILGHGGYTSDPAYEEERAALLRRLARGGVPVPGQAGPAGGGPAAVNHPQPGRSSA